MTGLICLWYGAIVDIPPGWAHCDGTQGTPDLRNRFVMGASVLYVPGHTGGDFEHNHTFTATVHAHGAGMDVDVDPGLGAKAWNFYAASGGAQSTGTTNNKWEVPPYHALAYIMKL